jgi:ubiquitin carboxyl-terminal hydrolase 34
MRTHSRKLKQKSASGGESEARVAAYALLNGLIKKSPVVLLKFMQDQLMPLMERIKKPKGWKFTPNSAGSDSLQKYCGLRNLGCICYMNSMMQQFFMVPAFRYNLMCVNDEIEEELKDYKNEKVDDNMLHQLQKLMSHLELSERSEFNPMEFCFSFKEFDGRPCDTSEQKDAQEFLNVFFDRLENQLKPTKRKHLLQSVFLGKYCNQLVCTECGKIKNRIENFYNLSLDIKNLKTV